jgi:uncharacterized C2H2 Zn-finger protein
MPEEKRGTEILKCPDCGEFLHIRINYQPKEFGTRTMTMCRQELFCPICDKAFNRNKLFSNQKHAKKTKGA